MYFKYTRFFIHRLNDLGVIMNTVTFLIDGEFMRKRIIAIKAFYFDGPGVRKLCLSHLESDEKIGKILFYDAYPFIGKGEHPITGPIDFSQTPLIKKKDSFLKSLKLTPEISTRLGRSAWQAGQWQLDVNKLGELIAGEIEVKDLQPNDIYPDIRQKGVDIQVGLDVATICFKKQADKVVLIANDADYVPAVQLLREEGIKVVLDPLWTRAAEDLRENVDYVCNKLQKPQGNATIFTFDDPKEIKENHEKEED